MAPLKAIKKDSADKRVLHIQGILKERQPISTNVRSQLDSILSNAFPPAKDVGLARRVSAFDELGSAIWNAATFMARDIDDGQQVPMDRTKLAVSLRIFGFLLLDASHCSSSRRRKDVEQRTRVFHVALKAAKSCLDDHALEHAKTVLERCSGYVEAVEEAPLIALVTDEETSAQETTDSGLTAQYYFLRVRHACASHRPDIANLLFDKINKSIVANSLELTGMAVELYYAIGNSFRETGNTADAIAWLERALCALNDRRSASTECDLEDLTLAVVTVLVECLLVKSDADGRQQADEILKELEDTQSLGGRLVVLSMHLKIVLAAELFSQHLAETLLLRMVTTAVLTEETFRTYAQLPQPSTVLNTDTGFSIMHCIHRVSQRDVKVACHALEQLVSARILPDLDVSMEDDQWKGWLEKATTTYTMLSASKACLDKVAARKSLTALFDLIHERSKDLPSPKATHALQTLIWKASGTLQGDESQAWFELLQHPLLDGAGLVNKARTGRKSIIMALENGHLDKARTAFYQMPKTVRDETMSRFLAYRLALQMQDDALAAESLRVILNQSTHDQRFLYASVLEAQQSGNRSMAVAALQTLVESPPAEAHLPSLLRCVARLLIGELDNLTRSLNEVAHEIIRIFEIAANQTKELFKGPKDQWRTEIQWWSKNAFNLALRLCADVDPSLLVRLLRVCTKFLDLYPDDAGLMHRDDLLRRKQLCHFLCCSAFIVLGRSAQDQAAERLQCYTEARREVGSFMSIWKQLADGSEEQAAHRARGLEMLKFDVESVFRLERWDDLDQVLENCLHFEGTCQWETLADLIIIIHDHTSHIGIDSSATSKIPKLLQKIINETWRKNRDVVKLARWLRVTFSMELGGPGGDMSLKLVEQAAKMAQRGGEGSHSRYPEDELQWLATSAFNQAVDLLGQGEHEAARTWIEGALELARYADDNGSLHAQLTRNQEEADRRMKRGVS